MENIESLYTFIDERATAFEKEQNVTYIEGVLETLNQWLDGNITPNGEVPTKEDIRKAVQLVLLKAMRQSVQANHQMTPDSLGLLVGYFVQQFFAQEISEKQPLELLDLAVGTGNLLTTIMNQMDTPLQATGVEIDELLIQIAAALADLTEQKVQLFRQDALQNLMISPADAVVCDVPVGYYPDEEHASTFAVAAEEEMTYAHHMFIEQAIRYTKAGGYIFLLVPNNLFESEQAPLLYPFIQKEAWIQAVVQLPESLFKQKEMAKSIFILQKKNEDGKAVKDVLLAKVPKMTNMAAMEKFFVQVRNWKRAEGK